MSRPASLSRLGRATACLLALLLLPLASCGDQRGDATTGAGSNGAAAPPPADGGAASSPAVAHEPFEGEERLRNLRQLTFGGQNAEAYWSFAGDELIFQSTRDDLEVDQIFIMDDDGANVRMVSTGDGRTTCAYFLPGDERILYGTTHLADAAPPEMPAYDRSLGYVWPIFNTYEVVVADRDGSNVENITNSPGYDAEATVSPKGDRVVFTSTRDGDLELYSMALDGSDVVRLTDAPGYDGGAFFSWDGKKIVWRAPNRQDVDPDEEEKLLRRQLVRPSQLEIWIMDADGSNKQMVTRNGAANFGPFWHPDNRRIIFASNMDDPRGMNFELYIVDTETGETERVTHFQRTREGAHRSDDFDGFPMFSADGKRLVFCSNRHNVTPNDTNVFVADWVD